MSLHVTSLLGLKDSLKMKLMKLNKKIHEVKTSSIFQYQVLSKNKDLFDDNLGELPVVYTMKVNSNATPIIKPSHKIPVAMENLTR